MSIAADARKGMRRAHERGVGLPGLGGVGDEAAGAAHQVVVLDARPVWAWLSAVLESMGFRAWRVFGGLRL